VALSSNASNIFHIAEFHYCFLMYRIQTRLAPIIRYRRNPRGEESLARARVFCVCTGSTGQCVVASFSVQKKCFNISALFGKNCKY
jgi:hypothetical protein